MPQSHVPNSKELLRNIRDIRRNHDRYTRDLDAIKQRRADAERALEDLRYQLEREYVVGRSNLSRQRKRENLEQAIRYNEIFLRDHSTISQVQRLESSIRKCERDASVIRRFTVNRRLLNRLVPQELADEIAAFDYRRRYPITYDDE
ncbi:hypothetical protein SPBR_09059 [Sporothrix brasiliensis 5110]|uniref:Uncharacterized protein n=1 Tax=Sporothrix brasiliensis 5110 TaxID=1398154 RepID=A0A0C2J099_9PEZI|nr:uncharacterized protein SPBR_09059 [Sporothrix brasiliensis 5110]KIH90602.1 hypothetical protein SPBR_09059 [Sporothrix brasiliensis 5110]